MPQSWINRAALYELLAHAFSFVTEELVQALASGEFAEALAEIGSVNSLDERALKEAVGELAVYCGRESEGLFREMRIEYTRLFIGAPKPAVSPFAGVWWARKAGVEPLLFVNRESMAVERFMRSCGVGQPEGTNEPLDHVGSELEFLQYLCLLRAKAVKPPESITVPEGAYEEFYTTHLASWIQGFAASTLEEARLPFYRAAARVLAALYAIHSA
jgi:TorA maturation chaperone TorD